MDWEPLAQLLTEDPKPFAQELVKCSGCGKEKFPGLLDIGTSCTVVTESTGEDLTHVTIRLRKYSNVRVDKIMKVEMFKQTLCNKVVSPLPGYFMRMDIMSYCRRLPLPRTVKNKT